MTNNNLEEYLMQAIETLEDKYTNKKVKPCSGYCAIDDVVNGFLNSELTIIGARPSMGKTALAMNIAVNLAKVGKKVLYISAEMNSDMIMNRIISSQTEIPLDRIISGDLTTKDWENTVEFANIAMEKLKDNLFIIPSFSEKFNKLSQLINDFSKENPDSLVIIDYFQLLNRCGQIEDRYVELADVAASIKRLAIINNIHIILLSQISKRVEERIDKRPQISDLSECDALSTHSDNVLFIHRDPEDENKATIIVSKAKNSRPCNIDMSFLPKIVKFKN